MLHISLITYWSTLFNGMKMVRNACEFVSSGSYNLMQWSCGDDLVCPDTYMYLLLNFPSTFYFRFRTVPINICWISSSFFFFFFFLTIVLVNAHHYNDPIPFVILNIPYTASIIMLHVFSFVFDSHCLSKVVSF